MKIWELLPIDPSNDNWAASTYAGSVVVRAENEDRAREIASLAFDTAATKPANGTVRYPPWRHPELVDCRELTDGSFDEDGDEAILDPPEYDVEWR